MCQTSLYHESFISPGLFTNTFGHIDILCTSVFILREMKKYLLKNGNIQNHVLLNSICVRRLSTRCFIVLSINFISSTVLQACITVEWSLPPKFNPIVFNEHLVSSFERYIATWRASTTSFFLVLSRILFSSTFR